MAAGQLRVEQVQAVLAGQGGAVPDRARRGGTAPGAIGAEAVQRGDHPGEMPLGGVPSRLRSFRLIRAHSSTVGPVVLPWVRHCY